MSSKKNPSSSVSMVKIREKAKSAKLGHVADEFGRVTEAKGGTPLTPKPIVDMRPIILGGIQHERWRGYTEILSTDLIAMALLSAEQGDLLAQMSLFEQMEERDPSLHAAMATRRNAVVGLQRVMQPARNEDDPDWQQAKDIADDVADVLEDIESIDGAVLNMSDGVGKGISVMIIDWDPDATICRLRHVNPVLYQFDRETGIFCINQREFALLDRIYPRDFPYKFVIHSPKMRSGHPTRGGVLRTLAWSYVFRNYSMKDWSVFCEVFGMPARIGKYKRGAGNAEKAQLASMLRMMASDAWAVISEDTMIEFQDIVNRGQEPFSAFQSALKGEYFLAILGQEGTSLVGKYGTKGDTAIKQMIRQDILESDCKQMEETWKRDILFPIVMYRHGLDAANLYTPSLHWKYEPPKDLKLEAEVDKIVLLDMGAGKEVRRRDVLKKYGWESAPKDTKPEDMLIDPTAPSPALVPVKEPSGAATGGPGTPSVLP